jgi:hypothetical protein
VKNEPEQIRVTRDLREIIKIIRVRLTYSIAAGEYLLIQLIGSQRGLGLY